MNTSKLLIALIGSIALPLAASAQGYQSGSQSGGQSGSSQQYQSGSQSGTSQSDMGRQSGQGTMERGSSGSSGMSRDTGAAAGAEGSAGLPMFDTLDTNKDGMISKAEAKKSATAKRDFRNLDTNHDGRISREEWQAGGGQGATNQ